MKEEMQGLCNIEILHGRGSQTNGPRVPEKRVDGFRVTRLGCGREDAAQVRQDGVHAEQSYNAACKQTCKEKKTLRTFRKKRSLGRERKSISQPYSNRDKIS